MRTKTLLLSALLGTVGSISAMSQSVYSINSVGYITIDLKPGFNMVADQLMATGGNAISNILNDADGHLDGLAFFQWTGTVYNQDFASSATSSFDNNWVGDGVYTLNPGQAAWLENPNPPGGADISITFVGTVPQGTNNVSIAAGFNQISSPAPIGGDLVTAAGLKNYNDGDAVFVWDPVAQGYNSYFVSFALGCCGDGGNWETSGDPIVAVGQGAWYETTTPFTYSQVFSVNQ